MDFSAFLVLPMQKNDNQPDLRASDDLSVGAELPVDSNFPPEQATTEEKIRLEVKDRSHLRYKTHDAKLEERVEPENVSLEDEWSIEKEPNRSYRMLWISVAVIVAATIGWAWYEISELKRQKRITIEEAKTLREIEEQAERDAWQTIQTIRGVAKEFFASDSLDAMLRSVRQIERVRPMMEKYYADKTIQPQEVVRFLELAPLTIPSSGDFWIVAAEMVSGKIDRLVIEVKSPVEAKVDWETFVCAQPLDWEIFVKERPDGYRGDFRVYAENDTFYNYEFADSEKYQSYKITTINSREVIYGYAPRDGKAYQTLARLLNQKTHPKVPVILRLHLPEGLHSKNGVLIEEVVAPRWLLVEDPQKAK